MTTHPLLTRAQNLCCDIIEASLEFPPDMRALAVAYGNLHDWILACHQVIELEAEDGDEWAALERACERAERALEAYRRE